MVAGVDHVLLVADFAASYVLSRRQECHEDHRKEPDYDHASVLVVSIDQLPGGRSFRPVARRLHRSLGQSPVWYVSRGPGGGSRTLTRLETGCSGPRSRNQPSVRNRARISGLSKAPHCSSNLRCMAPLKPSGGMGSGPTELQRSSSSFVTISSTSE